MGGVTDTLTNMLDPGHFFLGKKQDGADPALAQQQADLAKQQAAEKAKEDAMNRQRMSDMRSRVDGGFGGNDDSLG